MKFFAVVNMIQSKSFSNWTSAFENWQERMRELTNGASNLSSRSIEVICYIKAEFTNEKGGNVTISLRHDEVVKLATELGLIDTDGEIVKPAPRVSKSNVFASYIAHIERGSGDTDILDWTD